MTQTQIAEQILKGKKQYLSQQGIPDYLRTIVTYKDAVAAIVEALSLPPLCDDILDDMDRDDLEVAYRKLRDSNSIYWKAVADKHNEILELRKKVEALSLQGNAPKMGMGKLRNLLNQFDGEEISMSKLLEEINNHFLNPQL